MILRVGPFLYRVRFVEGYIEYDGQRCVGLCDNETHEVLVSTQTSFAQQVQVIGHEYMEAWLYHFGQNVTDKEDYCDLFGMAMAQFVLDLTRQLEAFGQEAGGVGASGLEDALRREEGGRAGVATKLAAEAARVGLSVGEVHEPGGA